MTEILRAIRARLGPPPRRHRVSRWPWLAAVVIAAGLGGALVWNGWRALVASEAFAVREIEITGAERLDPRALAAAFEDVRGTSILALDLDALTDRLSAWPTVRSAVVARHLPHRLDVAVRERTPVARIAGAAPGALVDADGVIFPRGREQPTDARLPLLRGLATPAGAVRLVPADRPALAAIAALAAVSGGAPPVGTTLDLTPRDKIVVRPGPDAPVLWLARDHPDLNLQELFLRRSSIVELRPGRTVDLRTPHLLTLPPEEGPEPR